MLSLRLLAAASAMVLVAATTPGHAMLSMNALTMNALNANALNPNSLTSNSLTSNSLTSNAVTQNAVTQNAVTQNALATTGSAIADLNGVAVEAISLPQVTHR